MDNSNNNNDPTQNGANQEVLKIEVFHGRNSFLKNQISGNHFLFQVLIDMSLFYVVQIIYVL
jgi:hypothetical protein